MSANTVEITAANWKSEVLDSSIPVLVDFWAEWCGPCKALAPILDQMGQELAGKMKVVKVDITSNQALAQQFRVMSIPTLLLFVGGVPKKQIIGARPKESLMSELQPFLS